MGSYSVFTSDELGQVLNGCKKPVQIVGIKGKAKLTTAEIHYLNTQDVSNFKNIIYNHETKFCDRNFFQESRVGLEHDAAPSSFIFMFKSKNEEQFTIIVFY